MSKEEMARDRDRLFEWYRGLALVLSCLGFWAFMRSTGTVLWIRIPAGLAIGIVQGHAFALPVLMLLTTSRYTTGYRRRG